MDVRLWIAAVVIAAGLSVAVRADEISELRKEVENQYNALLKMQSKLLEIEAQQQEQAKSVKKMESSVGSLKWAEKISLYGDFRFRYEQIDGKNTSQRDRMRIRARLGLKGKIDEEWKYDLRLASGSSDPTSSNQDLDGGFDSKNFWLDRAFLTYQPKNIEGLSVLAGKMGTPFYTVGGNQLIWDSDLNPEGVAVKYDTNLSESLTLFAVGGGMWVEERSSDVDTSLWGLQSGLTHLFENKSSLTGGAGIFCYGNIKGERAIGSFLGNSFEDINPGVGTDNRYVYDYKLMELFAEYKMTALEKPLSLYGDYVTNTASGVKGDTGWLLGTTFNKASDPGTWEFNYEYRDIEADAVLGQFSDSDFIGGGTYGKGHKFGFKYAIAKNVMMGPTAFFNKRDADGDGKRDDKYSRMQFDVEVKF